jgi:hypothetical protein
VNSQKYPLKTQEEIFLKLILNNENIVTILDGGFVEGINDWYLVAGCLNQTIWNQLTERAIDNDIKDYDIIYYDKDISENKEKQIQRKVQEKYKELNINIDVVNQARVHLWTEKDWGLKMRPLISCEDAISSWPITVSCVGIRKENEEYIIMAPYGLTDNLEMVLRPNKTTVMRESDFNYKTSKWLKKWPELTLLPW